MTRPSPKRMSPRVAGYAPSATPVSCVTTSLVCRAARSGLIQSYESATRSTRQACVSHAVLQITTVSRGAALRAAGHRGRGNRSRVKGGGHAFAALTVGSRRVGKRKTLAEMGANDKLMCGQRQPPRCGGLRARSRYQEDGAVERISLVESAHIRQHVFTASALRALPPRARLSVSCGRRWTALRRASPGSRAVGKH
jgi:hypothetical protein